MAKKQQAEQIVPDMVRTELVDVPRGEVGYWIEFTDEQVELLAQGICSREVAAFAWMSLAWKRDYQRKIARELAELAS